MVTGYDHLLFLVGVIFFLYRLKDVIQYVSLFTLGHSLTLLAGVLGGIHANAYIVDAIIGLSVVYKGFVSNIEDVDMAQALAQLNQNQVALQAAFQVTSTLNRLSLLDYLPII